LLFLRSKQCGADLQALPDVQYTHANRLALGNYTPGLDAEHSVPICSGQVFALDTGGAFIEPSPSFFLRTYGGYSRMTGYTEVGDQSDLSLRFADNSSRQEPNMSFVRHGNLASIGFL